ncbi:MAG TPA: MmgE/PrpD family protein [Paralcaligenes sp.]
MRQTLPVATAADAQTARSETQPLTMRVAEKICHFQRPMATPFAMRQACTAMTDTIAVALAGAPESCTQILLNTPGIATAPGKSLVFATKQRTSALDATLVNGTASHALDYDDFSGVMGGHQSAPIVPALFALGEEHRSSGEKIVLAYLVGVETELRFSRAVNMHHYDIGWHPTSTLGVFGAAAATSYLLGLDIPHTAMALAIAASLANGLKANFGTMTKPLHIGQCGRNGLLATLLAAGGFDANPAVLEHQQGFLNVFNGPGLYDSERLLSNWGRPLEVEDPTIGLKQFPCCGSTHPAIMMALQLVQEESVHAEDVVNITIMPHGRRLKHTDNPHPASSLEAKFSVQYVVARALVDGDVRLKDFEGNAYNEPAVRRLLAITTAQAHPDMADDADGQWGAEVIVALKDGRKLSRRVDNLVGRGGDNPMTRAELWRKFSNCAEKSLAGRQIEPLFEQLQQLDQIPDINQITGLMLGAERA